MLIFYFANDFIFLQHFPDSSLVSDVGGSLQEGMFAAGNARRELGALLTGLRRARAEAAQLKVTRHRLSPKASKFVAQS